MVLFSISGFLVAVCILLGVWRTPNISLHLVGWNIVLFGQYLDNVSYYWQL